MGGAALIEAQSLCRSYERAPRAASISYPRIRTLREWFVAPVGRGDRECCAVRRVKKATTTSWDRVASVHTTCLKRALWLARRALAAAKLYRLRSDLICHAGAIEDYCDADRGRCAPAASAADPWRQMGSLIDWFRTHPRVAEHIDSGFQYLRPLVSPGPRPIRGAVSRPGWQWRIGSIAVIWRSGTRAPETARNSRARTRHAAT